MIAAPIAYVITGGLLVGAILTLVLLPTLYWTWFGWKASSSGKAATAAA